MLPKVVSTSLGYINRYFGRDLSKYCSERTVGNVGARVLLPQIEVFPP